MNLSLAQLQRYVDQRYIDRGRGYFERGLVVLHDVSEKRVRASCSGNRVYAISLSERGGKLDGNCNCPAFEDFGPCKHIAATALAVMADEKGKYSANEAAVEHIAEYQAVRERLLEMEKTDLVDFILRVADGADIVWMIDEEE